MAINNTLKDIREERNLVQADLAKLSVLAVIPSDALSVVSEMPLSKLQSVWHII